MGKKGENFYKNDIAGFRQYYETHTQHDCAEHYGVCVRRIQFEANKLNFELKLKRRQPILRKHNHSLENYQMVYELSKTHSLYSIADLLKCSVENVSYFLRKWKEYEGKQKESEV